jgi:hypothetical protein
MAWRDVAARSRRGASREASQNSARARSFVIDGNPTCYRATASAAVAARFLQQTALGPRLPFARNGLQRASLSGSSFPRIATLQTAPGSCLLASSRGPLLEDLSRNTSFRGPWRFALDPLSPRPHASPSFVPSPAAGCVRPHVSCSRAPRRAAGAVICECWRFDALLHIRPSSGGRDPVRGGLLPHR